MPEPPFVTPSRLSPVDGYLEQVHADCLPMRDGSVAGYIPALAAADPEPFGLCVATVDGHVYATGDAATAFTIQSISKPFTYALAIADRGLDAVLAKIGVEPSGDAFNEIRFDGRGRPFNPMINAGAIAATALVDGGGSGSGDRFTRILDWYSRWAGRPLALDVPVYEGERETGHRNRAIAYMLRAGGILEDCPEPALDAYFRQCSVDVTALDLAVMAATLAARGRNPVTGEQVVDGDVVDHVLSVMTTCGMYDGAGQWLVDVGMPAKSGVGGGIVAVLPGQIGIASFSPRLDAVGNSVRGVAAFRRLSTDLHLHFLHAGRSVGSAQVERFELADVPSTRGRTAAQRAAIDAARGAAVVYEASGDVQFIGAETIARLVTESSAQLQVVDLHRAGSVDVAAGRLFDALARDIAPAGRRLVIAAAPEHLPSTGDALTFPTAHAARQWCEDTILAATPLPPPIGPVALADHDLVAGLTDVQVAELRSLCSERTFAAGEKLVRSGDRAGEIYLLLAGEVQIGDHESGAPITTRVAGTAWGTAALLGISERLADVTALSGGRVSTLAIDALRAADPGLDSGIRRNVLAISRDDLARAAREIRALAR